MSEAPDARSPRIVLARLRDVSLDDIADHMNDPRVAEHMPLLMHPWSRQDCEAFVRAKEACWERDGLGHWAILVDGLYAGWGGFQKEGGEWDFGLVLKPERFGLGPRLVRMALDLACADARIPYVTFLLPTSREHLRPLTRLGARFVGEAKHEGRVFLKYRMETM